MCGISGFTVYKESFESNCSIEKSITKMVKASHHRGPDSKNVYIDDSICLGHARLSFVDLSDAGNQPIVSSDGSKLLIFNGEIYNYKKIRSKIEDYEFKSKSDTEIFLASVVKYGLPQTLEVVDGPFAFALYDKKNKSLTLGRDKFGEKPLYYTIKKGVLSFASDLNILNANLNQYPPLSKSGLNSYLELGFIEDELTIFKDIFKIQPGMLMHFDLNEPQEIYNSRKERYFSFEKFNKKLKINKKIKKQEAINQTEKLLINSIKDRLDADVEIGCLLSGGIDSSVIAAIANDIQDKPIKTFTIGYEDKRFDESEKAKKIATYLGCDHYEFIPSKKLILDAIQDCSNVYSEPFADSSQIQAYLITQFASKEVKGVLTGDGGDEIFAGYSRYRLGFNAWEILSNLSPQFLKNIYGLASNLNNFKDKENNTFLGISNFDKKLFKLYEIAEKKELRQYFLYLVSNISKDFYPDILSDDLIVKVNRDSFFKQINNDYPKKNLMLMDLLMYLPHNNLVKMDRVSMYHSLEVRCPMLNFDLYKYVSTLEKKWVTSSAESKYLLRQILKKYVPNKIMAGPKKGFSIPIDDYFRNELKDWVYVEMIENLSSIFSKEKSLEIYNKHIAGSDNSSAIWRIISFNKWFNRRYNLDN